MDEELFDDCTYIGTNSSPRSDTLPKFYDIEKLDFNLNVNIRTTIPNLLKVIRRLTSLEVRTNKVLIEYDGNFLLNFILIMFFFKKDIHIDCHNCAVENEAGKLLRYFINVIYLYLTKVVFGARLIVHNPSVMRNYPIDCSVVHTPYPNLDQYICEQKNNDVLFSCSLNSDEPIGRIIQACIRLKDRGYTARVTGDFSKLPHELQIDGKPFFSGYIPKSSYFQLLANSKAMVCLTTRDQTLLYSPREGISLGLPVIINSSQVNVDFFGDKAIYVDSEDDLTEAIINAIK